MRVLAVDRYQGRVTTGSFVTQINPQFQTCHWLGTLQLSPKDLADPNLSIRIKMLCADDPLNDRPIAVYEWQGGQNRIPQVMCSYVARSVCLQLDIMRTNGDPKVAVGATITQSF
ncbi:MAG: hypothetical protein KGL39_51535 [Patescibacteria group bacterium]|nr:hypothetical protein [Patescibacteria group bacterium]